MYLSQEQTKELITMVGVTAHLVFTHYVAMAHTPVSNMEDDHIAKLTSLSERTVKRARLALTNIGWFLRIKDTYRGETKYTYLVGKEAVNATYRSVIEARETEE